MDSVAPDDILKVVRSYLDARVRADGSARSWIAGAVRFDYELGKSLVPQQDYVDGKIQLDRLALAQVASPDATVECEATLTWLVVGEGGMGPRITETIEGPMRLRQVDGNWKVVDYVRNGRSVAGGLRRDVRGNVKAKDIELELRAMDFRADWVIAFLRVINTGSKSIRLKGARLSIEGRDDVVYRVIGTPRLVPHREGNVEAAWPVSSEAPVGLQAAIGIEISRGAFQRREWLSMDIVIGNQ